LGGFIVAGRFTKADIVDALYDNTGMDRKEIRKTIDLFVSEIKAALLRRDVIELRGFGTFELKVRKGRSRARNPRTGEQVQVRPHGIVCFRPGRELKQEAWVIKDENL
jgi:integration host factor subunit beta